MNAIGWHIYFNNCGGYTSFAKYSGRDRIKARHYYLLPIHKGALNIVGAIDLSKQWACKCPSNYAIHKVYYILVISLPRDIDQKLLDIVILMAFQMSFQPI